MGRLDGKVAMITGGARGQGRAHAVTLAREGADIILVDVAKEIEGLPFEPATFADLSETAAAVEDLDRRVIAIQGDVRSQPDLDSAVARGIEEFGQIDILVANAGIWTIGRFWELSDERWQLELDVCLTGVWRSAKAVAPHMIERRTGSIVMTSSVLGFEGSYASGHYVAAKHGVLGLMRTAAIELGPYGVRCNAICPGFTDTRLNDRQDVYDLMAGGSGGKPEHRVQAARHWSLLTDVALIPPNAQSNAVLWLVSDESAYVTGIAIPVDAGHLASPGFNPAPSQSGRDDESRGWLG